MDVESSIEIDKNIEKIQNAEVCSQEETRTPYETGKFQSHQIILKVQARRGSLTYQCQLGCSINVSDLRYLTLPKSLITFPATQPDRPTMETVSEEHEPSHFYRGDRVHSSDSVIPSFRRSFFQIKAF